MTYWAVSDIHGYYNFYEKIKNKIDPDDKVICLGDCGDYGPKSWETIKAVLNDSQFIYLKGNHEDMLARALQKYINDTEKKSYHYDNDVRLCWCSGGKNTFDKAITEPNTSDYINKLNNLAYSTTYTNPSGKTFYLCHSGNVISTPHTKADLWDREHMKEITYNYPGYDYVVHGHTPVSYGFAKIGGVSVYDGKAFFYCEGHKINIDAGSYNIKKGLLFNLDTLKSTVFTLN